MTKSDRPFRAVQAFEVLYVSHVHVADCHGDVKQYHSVVFVICYVNQHGRHSRLRSSVLKKLCSSLWKLHVWLYRWLKVSSRTLSYGSLQ